MSEKRYDVYRYFFSPVEGKYKQMRSQWLHAHHMLSAQEIALWPEIVEREREYHRRSIGEKITEAIYEGWFPDSIDWYEGEEDYSLREIRSIPRTKDEYHFYTKVHLVAPDAYAVTERKPDYFSDDMSVRMQQWRPKDLK